MWKNTERHLISLSHIVTSRSVCDPFCSAGIFKTFPARTCHWTLWQSCLTGCFYWGLLEAVANGRAITFMGSLRWHPCILDGLLNRSHQLQWFSQSWKQKQGGYLNCQHNANQPLHSSPSVRHNDCVIGCPAALYIKHRSALAKVSYLKTARAISVLWCHSPNWFRFPLWCFHSVKVLLQGDLRERWFYFLSFM